MQLTTHEARRLYRAGKMDSLKPDPADIVVAVCFGMFLAVCVGASLALVDQVIRVVIGWLLV